MLPLAIVGSVLFSVFWSLLIGRIAASGSSVLATAMITMAFGEIMRNLMGRWRSVTNGADGLNYKNPAPFDNRTFVYCKVAQVITLLPRNRNTNICPRWHR